MDARSQVTSEKKVLYLLTNDVVKYRNYHFLHKITCGNMSNNKEQHQNETYNYTTHKQ